MQAEDMTGRRTALYFLFALLAAGVMLLPHWPGLIDLPGHVARYHVELALSQSPLLQRYYDFTWMVVPNLGVDLLIYPLAKLIGLEPAARVIVAAIPALTIIGMLALAKVAHGRINPLALMTVPCAFGYPFTFGFVNYCLSAALAFCAAAIWVRLIQADRPVSRTLFGVLASPVLLIAHLMGWGLFGLIAFGSLFAASRERGIVRAAVHAGIACIPLAWPLIILALAQPHNPGVNIGWFSLLGVLKWSAVMLRERWMVVDIGSAMVLFAVAGLPLLLWRRFAYELVLFIPAVLTWVAIIVMPMQLLGSAFANVRLVPAALALSILAVRPLKPLPRFVEPAVMLFVLARLAITASALLAFDVKATRQLSALKVMTPGSRVLGFAMQRCTRTWAPPRSQNLQLLATARRDVLINSHFTEAGAQLLTIRFPAAPGLMHFGSSSIITLKCWRSSYPTLREALTASPIKAFDYLWLLDVPAAQLPHDPELKPIWRASDSIVYAIRRS